MKRMQDKLVVTYGISPFFPHGSRLFKQLQLQGTDEIPPQKPSMEQLISISADVDITSSYLIATSSGLSCEGQRLTGKKLIVEGKLCLKLEYVGDTPLQPIHGVHFVTPFSSYIVVGKDLSCCKDFEMAAYIEDLAVKQLDERKVYKNVLLLLNAVPLMTM